MLPPLGYNSGRGWDQGAALDWGHIGVEGGGHLHPIVMSLPSMHTQSQEAGGHAMNLVGHHHLTHPSEDCWRGTRLAPA